MKPQQQAIIRVLIALFAISVLFTSIVVADELEQRVEFAQPVLVVNTSFLNVRTGPGVQYSVLVTVVGGTELPVLGVANDGVWYQVATDGGAGWVNVDFTLARGNFTNVPLASVDTSTITDSLTGENSTSSTVNISSSSGVTGVYLVGGDLRAQPSYDALVIRSAMPNDPNTIYPLLGQSRDSNGVVWYLVNVSNIGTGWLDKIGFAPIACGNEVVGMITGETPISFEGISTQDSYLLAKGTQGFVVGRNPNNNSQLRFQLVDGTVGNVFEGDVANRTGVVNVCDNVPASLGQGGGALPQGASAQPVQPTLTANRVIINTGFLNIRSGPSAAFGVVATVPGGTELAVIGRATDNVWFLVEGSFGQGWINNQFAIFRGVYDTVPVIRDAMGYSLDSNANLGQGGGVAPSSVGSGLQVTGVTLVGGDLRTDPSYNSVIIRSAIPNDPNTIYPLLGQTVDTNGVTWYLVNISSIGQGWVDKIAFSPLQCGNDVVGRVLNAAPINFEGISTRDSYLLEPNTDGYIVGRRGSYLILQLVDGTIGNVPEDAVVPRSPDIVSVCQGVTQVTGGTNNQTSGDSISSPPSPAVSGNRVIINTGNLNIRSGPSAVFSVVATVPGGTELQVVGRARDGVWYLVQGAFGEGWINSQFALFRGNYATVPVIDVSAN